MPVPSDHRLGSGGVKRSEVMAYRIRAQQLGRPEARRGTDADIFDFGVQDTGRDGASWALANRGVPVTGAEELESSPDVALAWTLRSSPHYYRRTELWDVMVATSPFSDADAAKRVVGADKPLRAAGIPARTDWRRWPARCARWSPGRWSRARSPPG
jgi:hypothetical protein